MGDAPAIKTSTHIVDILGNVVGRDQPIMLMERAIQLASLLDQEAFQSDDVVFFDPFCKAGEILLSCALLSCRAKAATRGLVDLDTVKRELYESNRYFALAPDERHHRLSLRTFLGNSQSHNPAHNHVIRNGNYVSEVDGRLDHDAFGRELGRMLDYVKDTSKKKSVIAVGNPPYQESDGGFGGSATAVYNHFVESLMGNKDVREFVVVIPSRWFSAGKGVDAFRQRIIESPHVKTIHHFKNSKSVFPTVDVLGGVCFFHYAQSHTGPVTFSAGDVRTEVSFKKYDIVLDDPFGYTFIDKIKNKWSGEFVSDVAWTMKPFGLRTDYFKKNDSLKEGHPNAIPCFSKNRKILYADARDISKNRDKVDEWKVAIPRAYAPGSKLGVRRVTLPIDQFFIIPKGNITTETYNVVGSFKTKSEAENFKSYLQTNFARYLLGLRKITQDIPKDRWDWVPMVSAKESWSDERLAKLFGLTAKETAHIKTKVAEWS